MKYKYVIYDIYGFLIDSKNDYDEIFSTYEEAKKECLTRIKKINESRRRELGDSLRRGFYIEEVK